MTVQEPEFSFTACKPMTVALQRMTSMWWDWGYPSQPTIKDMDNRSYPSHCDRTNFHVEADISEYSDTDSENEELSSEEETWLTDE